LGRARFDADYLTGAAFDRYQPGKRIGGPENAGFVCAMFANMTPEERGGLMAADGSL